MEFTTIDYISIVTAIIALICMILAVWFIIDFDVDGNIPSQKKALIFVAVAGFLIFIDCMLIY